MKVAAASVLVSVAILLFFLGRRVVMHTHDDKISVLARLDGKEVIIGVGELGGSAQLVLSQTGRLRVPSKTSSNVILAGPQDRVVFLDEIRWIKDVETGTRYGDNW